VLVHLTQEEQDKYIELSKKISKLYAYQDSNNEDALKILLMKRAKIISSAENKLPMLKEILIKKRLEYSDFNLFYCAAKTIEDEENTFRMVDQVHNLVQSLGMNVENFTAMDSASKEERIALIMQLKKQIIDGLVAIKCLDEGVDIPDVRRAFILSSSSNPKEFIQRRGRVLRKAEGKEFSEIYDFLVVPFGYSNDGEYKANKKYLEKELLRYREFAKLALNYPNCEKMLIDIMSEYNLLYL
jgi:superfamily II DNA or RNA helicase